MSEKPKRRWYQFSLRTLMAVVTLVAGVLGMALGFRSHKQFCSSQCSYYFLRAVHMEPDDPQFSSVEAWKAARLDTLRLASAWYHAEWRPWERLWIDDRETTP